MQNEINRLIAQHLSGTITEEGEKQLNMLRKADKKIDEAIKHIESLDDLPQRYREYASVNSDAALGKFLMQHSSRARRFSWRGVAAGIAALMVLTLGAFYFMNNEEKHPVAVVQQLPQDVLNAMKQSTEKGKNQGTTVALKNIRISEGDDNLSQSGDKDARIAALVARITHTPIANIDAKMDELLSTTTYYDKEFWLKLDDGTLVHINNNTRVIYPEHFGKNKREVIIDGEAYFMVAHDDTRPFIVHTPQGDVRDYGTEFFVSTNQLSTTVALISGKVSVTQRGGSERMMSPGQEASLTDSGLSIAAQDMTAYKAWNTGTFLFHNKPLEEILNVMSRWYNVDVRFADNNLRTIRFTGSFDRYESMSPMLNAICEVTGLKWIMKDGVLEIRR